MKLKKIIIIIFSLFTASYLFSGIPDIINYLENGKWISTDGSRQIIFEYVKNELKYELLKTGPCQDSMINWGKCKIIYNDSGNFKDDIFNLYYNSDDIYLKNGKLNITDNDIYSQNITFDNGGKYYNINSKTSNGKSITIDSIPSISIGYKPAILLANMKFRTFPDISAKTITVKIYKDDPAMSDEPGPNYIVNEYPYVPIDQKVTVLARTEKKYQVANWSNYWYYVEFHNWYETKRGWMFAEFIIFEK